MNWPDLINGLFEMIGAYFTWRNYIQLKRDRHLAGVYWPTTAFFSAWGIWNLIYYPALNQWASFAGGVLLVAGNVAWVALALSLKAAEPRTAPKSTPTLECDSFVDKAIATCSYCLWERHDGGITNAIQLLVRPLDVRCDESGSHPDENGFVMITITREELREMVKLLDEDWRRDVLLLGDPNLPQPREAAA